MDYAVGTNRRALVAGDFDSDGRLDLAVASSDLGAGTGGVVSVLRGAGNGTFQEPVTIAAGINKFSDPTVLVAGDFDSDGRLDLAVASSDLGAGTGTVGVVSVLRGAGDGTFQEPVTIVVGTDATGVGTSSTSPALVVGDFNDDGRLDLAAGLGTGLFAGLSRDDGTLSDPRTLPAAMHATPVVADLSGDGVDDLLVIDQAGQILWRKGRTREPGSFEPPVTVNPDLPARDLTIVPTRQGPLIASVDARDNAVTLYAYRGGEFARVGSLPTGLLPAQIQSTDLNGDGNADLVVRNAGDGMASLYLGDGQGRFTPLPPLPIGQARRTSPWPTSIGPAASTSSSPTRSPATSASSSTAATRPSARRRDISPGVAPTDCPPTSAARPTSRLWKGRRAWPSPLSPRAASPTS